MARKRNANGMGSWHYDEKRELWRFRITDSGSIDENGRPRQIDFTGKTQEIARARYQEWKDNDAYAPLRPSMTVEKWGRRWLDDYSKKVEESTAAGYEYTLAHITKHLGRMRVCDVRAVHVEKMLEDMAGEYSQSQVGKCRTMLGQMMRKAEASEMIRKNPVALADRLNYRRVGGKRVPKKDAYTAAEVAALFKGLPNTRIGHSVRLMLATGICTQELLGVTQMDISTDGSVVRIVRAVKIKEGGKMYIGDVKAVKRDRLAQVPPTARTSAIFLRENASGWILGGKSGKLPMHPSTYRKFYKAAVSGVLGADRTLTPHCCRHTYISHLQDGGADFAVIQALAGQSEKSATIQYIHAQSPAIQRAVEAVESLITGTPIGTPTAQHNMHAAHKNASK